MPPNDNEDSTLPGGMGNGLRGSTSSSASWSQHGQGATSFSSKFEFKVPGLTQTNKDLNQLNEELESLHKKINQLNSDSTHVKDFFGSISSGAKNALTDVKALNSEMASGSGLGYGGGGGTGGGGGGGGGGGMFSGGATAGGGGGGLSDLIQGAFSSTVGNAQGSGILGGIQALGNLILKPVQLLYNRVEENRAATMRASQYLGPAASRYGGTEQGLLNALGNRTPILGGYDDLMQAIGLGARMGFGINPNQPGQNGGFWTAARQFQQLNPGIAAPNIVGELGGYMGNAKAVQTSVMFGGGAFSFQAAGGKQKSLADWAAGLLRFFQDQRPGQQHGKPFSQQELQAQQFPGSNIDAWFTLNQVPQDLRDAFWQYAINQAGAGGGATWDQIVGLRGPDLLKMRLQGETTIAQRDIQFAGATNAQGGTMYNQYVTRESADTQFQKLLMDTLDKLFKGVSNTGFGQIFSQLPTPVAGMLYQLLMSSPTIATKAIGSFLPPALVGNTGDPGYNRHIGDIGGYGPLGGTGLFGLTPTMADRLGAMLADNPNLSVTSGYRDGATQSRLFMAGAGALAPPGQSTHAQGIAADIGPESEYGWIAANAGKYGLQVAGDEPWHVGLPGSMPIGDPRRRRHIGDSILDKLSNTMLGMATGASPLSGGFGPTSTPSTGGTDTGVPGISDILSMLGSLLNPLGMLSTGLKLITGGPMAAITGGLSQMMGMIPGMGGLMSNPIGTLLGFIGGGGGGFTAGGLFGSALGGGGALGSMLDPAGGIQNSANAIGRNAAGAIANAGSVQNIETKFFHGSTASQKDASGSTSAIITALKALRAAGFSGDNLVAWGAIAGGESGWNPMKHNSKPPDDSYGLWQINMLGGLGPARRRQFGLSSNNDLYDPNVNAKAAWSISGGGKNSQPWTGSLKTDATYVQSVYQIAKAQGMIGDPAQRVRYMMGDPAGTTNVASYGITGGPTYHISVSMPIQTSRATEPDARRLADQLGSVVADKLQQVVELHG